MLTIVFMRCEQIENIQFHKKNQVYDVMGLGATLSTSNNLRFMYSWEQFVVNRYFQYCVSKHILIICIQVLIRLKILFGLLKLTQKKRIAINKI